MAADYVITIQEYSVGDDRTGITASVLLNGEPLMQQTQSQRNELYSRYLCVKAAFYKMLDDGVFADEAPF